MRFLIDASLSPRIVEEMRLQRHDAQHLAETGLQDEPDAAIFARAESEGRMVVTADTDFAMLAATRGTPTTGVVLIRLNSLRLVHLLPRFRAVLSEIVAHLPGAIVTVDETRIRARRLPIAS